MTTRNLPRGALLIVLALFVAAVRSAFSKLLLEEGISTPVILLFQSVIALVILGPWIFRRGLKQLAGGSAALHALRCGSGFAAMYCFVWALTYTTITKTILLNNTSPLFIPLITAAFFRRRHRPVLFAALCVGFAGIALILRPEPGAVTFGDALALASGVLAAFSMLFVRLLRRKEEEPPEKVIFYYLASIIVLSACLSAFEWTPVTAPVLWLYLVCAGVLYAVFQLLFTEAFVHASATAISPFIYFGVIFAGLIDWVVWKNVPDLVSAAGIVMVVTGAVLTTRLYAQAS